MPHPEPPRARSTQVVSLEGKEIGPSNPSASDLCFLISCPPVHLTVSAKDRKVATSPPLPCLPSLPPP